MEKQGFAQKNVMASGTQKILLEKIIRIGRGDRKIIAKNGVLNFVVESVLFLILYAQNVALHKMRKNYTVTIYTMTKKRVAA